jgi:hypothetical protein
MKQFTTLVVIALACSFAQAAESTAKPQQTRMAVCQKEATASGKKGKERSEVLRGCLSAAKKDTKAAKPA